MTNTGSQAGEPPAAGGNDGPPRGRRARTSSAQRLVGVAGWSVLLLLGALLAFYGWRSGANNEALTLRNLRELDRIGRAVEGRAEGFAAGMRGWFETTRRTSYVGLVPGLRDPREGCPEGRPRARVTPDGVRFCYLLAPARPSAAVPSRKSTKPKWWSGLFELDSLGRALRSDIFDATFIADDSGAVFVTYSGSDALAVPRQHRGLTGRRLHAIPGDTAESSDRVSTVRPVTIAGREYRLFLQPLQIRGPRDEPLDEHGASPAPAQWSVGGLISTSRFRAESLSLDPPHLIFLGLLLVLAFLALPFVRTMLMGPMESIKPADIYLLSLSLAVGMGVLGIAAADVRHYGPFVHALDRNIALAADRLRGALHREIGLAIRELDRWDCVADGGPTRTTDIFRFASANECTVLDPREQRHLRFQMLIRIDSAGMQQAKLTPRATNTPLIPVRDREYVRRIRDGRSYLLPGAAGGAPVHYYLESIRSRNTGEKIATLSAPWCPDGADTACRNGELGIRAMTTRLASLDEQLLPPGAGFAVVRRDGLTLFHSDPGRNLEENFLDETGDNGELRALFAAWEPGNVRTTYMGSRSRMHVSPLPGTGADSLNLVVVLDERYVGATHFESLFVSLAVFLGWILALLGGFLLVELLVPGRLRWAWPDRRRPWKYPVLATLMLGFASLLALQAVFASRMRVPIDAGSLLVPLQALSVALLVQAAGAWEDRSSWRGARIIGWSTLVAVTLLQLALHRGSSVQGLQAWLLRVAALAMVVVAAVVVLRLDGATRKEERDEGLSRIALEPWYVAAIVATLMTTALLPAWLLHQEALTQSVTRLIHYEQRQLLDGLRQRELRIAADNRDVGLVGFDDAIIRQDFDLALAPLFDAPAPAAPAPPGTVRAASGSCRADASDLRTRVFTRVEKVTPFINAAAVELRHFNPASGGLEPVTCDRNAIALAGSDGGGLPHHADRLLRSRVPGTDPLSAGRLLWLLTLVAGGTGIAAALALWLGRRVFLLDLPSYEPLELQHLVASVHRGNAPIAAICKRSMDRKPLLSESRLRYIDLIACASGRRDLDEELGGARERDEVAVLDYFDHRLNDEAWNEKLLGALETHVSMHQAKVVIMTSREPCALFPLGGDDSPAGSPSARWSRLLGHFVDLAIGARPDALDATTATTAGGPATGLASPYLRIVRLVVPSLPRVPIFRLHTAPPGDAGGAESRSDTPADAGPAPAAQVGDGDETQHERGRVQAALARERTNFPHVREIVRHLGWRPDFQRLSTDGAVEQVRDMADSYYHALWSILDPDERLVATQLAYGVVVNPNGKRAVRRLLARNVLVRDPELRLMNASFRRFVREEVPASVIAEWERGAPTSAWQKVRFPIGLGLVAVVAFLFVTQRSAFDNAMALVTAAGVGTTAILRLLAAARTPGRGPD